MALGIIECMTNLFLLVAIMFAFAILAKQLIDYEEVGADVPARKNE